MGLEDKLKSSKIKKALRVSKPLIISITGLAAHEYIHGLASLAFGGTFEGISFVPSTKLNSLIPGIGANVSPDIESKYYFLQYSAISLAPHLLLGIPGIHLIKNEIDLMKPTLIKLGTGSNLASIFATLGFYLTIPYGLADIYGHGTGGGDFVQATQYMKAFMSGYGSDRLMEVHNNVPNSIETFAIVASTFGLSFLGYLASKNLPNKIKSYYDKLKILIIKW